MQTKKSLGQHFLRDVNTISRIIDSFKTLTINKENFFVIEVGPGDGALTRSLIDCYDNIVLIDCDKKIIDFACENFGNKTSKIIHQDATLNLASTILELKKEKEDIFIISNLPYNVGAIILLNAISVADKWNGGVFMLQKEVVDRLVAQTSSKSYGKISIIFQIFFQVKRIINVSGASFSPATQVTSTVFSMLPRSENIVRFLKYFKEMSGFLTVAFSSRRKFAIKAFYEYFDSNLVDEFYSNNKLDTKMRIEEFYPLQIAEMVEFLTNN